MSAFSAAARELIESDLVCPRCQEENSPSRPHKIRIDDVLADSAGCDTCGFGGHVSMFTRKEPPR